MAEAVSPSDLLEELAAQAADAVGQKSIVLYQEAMTELVEFHSYLLTRFSEKPAYLDHALSGGGFVRSEADKWVEHYWHIVQKVVLEDRTPAVYFRRLALAPLQVAGTNYQAIDVHLRRSLLALHEVMFSALLDQWSALTPQASRKRSDFHYLGLNIESSVRYDVAPLRHITENMREWVGGWVAFILRTRVFLERALTNGGTDFSSEATLALQVIELSFRWYLMCSAANFNHAATYMIHPTIELLSLLRSGAAPVLGVDFVPGAQTTRSEGGEALSLEKAWNAHYFFSLCHLADATAKSESARDTVQLQIDLLLGRAQQEDRASRLPYWKDVILQTFWRSMTIDGVPYAGAFPLLERMFSKVEDQFLERSIAFRVTVRAKQQWSNRLTPAAFALAMACDRKPIEAAQRLDLAWRRFLREAPVERLAQLEMNREAILSRLDGDGTIETIRRIVEALRPDLLVSKEDVEEFLSTLDPTRREQH